MQPASESCAMGRHLGQLSSHRPRIPHTSRHITLQPTDPSRKKAPCIHSTAYHASKRLPRPGNKKVSRRVETRKNRNQKGMSVKNPTTPFSKREKKRGHDIPSRSSGTGKKNSSFRKEEKMGSRRYHTLRPASCPENMRGKDRAQLCSASATAPKRMTPEAKVKERKPVTRNRSIGGQGIRAYPCMGLGVHISAHGGCVGVC